MNVVRRRQARAAAFTITVIVMLVAGWLLSTRVLMGQPTDPVRDVASEPEAATDRPTDSGTANGNDIPAGAGEVENGGAISGGARNNNAGSNNNAPDPGQGADGVGGGEELPPENSPN